MPSARSARAACAWCTLHAATSPSSCTRLCCAQPQPLLYSMTLTKMQRQKPATQPMDAAQRAGDSQQDTKRTNEMRRGQQPRTSPQRWLHATTQGPTADLPYARYCCTPSALDGTSSTGSAMQGLRSCHPTLRLDAGKGRAFCKHDQACLHACKEASLQLLVHAAISHAYSACGLARSLWGSRSLRSSTLARVGGHSSVQ